MKIRFRMYRNFFVLFIAGITDCFMVAQFDDNFLLATNTSQVSLAILEEAYFTMATNKYH